MLDSFLYNLLKSIFGYMKFKEDFWNFGQMLYEFFNYFKGIIQNKIENSGYQSNYYSI